MELNEHTKSLLQYFEFKAVIDTAVDEAIKQTKKDIARAMLRNGLNAELVATISSLSLQRVQALQQQLLDDAD